MTVPLLAVAAIGIVASSGGGSSSPTTGPGGPLTLAAPPSVNAQAAACTKVIEQLPIKLNTLDPRIVDTTPSTPFVVAWGNPAVVLRCGVARPADLKPGSATQYIQSGTVANGPAFDVTKDGTSNVFTTVDRAAYVSITVPPAYQGGDVVPPLSDAIAKALPPVCGVPDSNGVLAVQPACTQRP